jgi:hypothetical protein
MNHPRQKFFKELGNIFILKMISGYGYAQVTSMPSSDPEMEKLKKLIVGHERLIEAIGKL